MVWLASASGSEAKLLGPGNEPLLAPDGQSVAVTLFARTPATAGTRAALGVYSAAGAPVADTWTSKPRPPRRWRGRRTGRYLAVYSAVHERYRSRRARVGRARRETGTDQSIAEGAIYGASFAPDASDRLVFGLGHSLSPLCTGEPVRQRSRRRGPASDDQRRAQPVPAVGAPTSSLTTANLRTDSPEFQIWLAAPGGGGRAVASA